MLPFSLISEKGFCVPIWYEGFVLPQNGEMVMLVVLSVVMLVVLLVVLPVVLLVLAPMRSPETPPTRLISNTESRPYPPRPNSRRLRSTRVQTRRHRHRLGR